LIIMIDGYGVFVHDGWWFLTNKIMDVFVF
jgi:hypothetical protein